MILYSHKKRINIFLQITLILFSIIFYFNYNNLVNYAKGSIYCAYLLIILVLIISLIANGLDFITLLLTFSALILIPITIQYLTGVSYGLLGLNLYQLYLPDILTCIYIYSTTMVFLSILFRFLSKELLTINNAINNTSLSTSAIIINNLIAIIFTIVAFPRLGMATYGNRFNMLLPGHAWNQLAIVALLFNLPYIRSHISVKITYLFVISWFLIDGERADITGLIFGIFILYFLTNKVKKLKINKVKFISLTLLMIAFVIILNFIVLFRNNETVNFSKAISGIFTTATLSDVGYLFNISIDYWHKFGTLNGSLLKSNLLSAIPFLNTYDFGKFVDAARYPNPGGESIYSEPLMDFGLTGQLLIATLDFFIYRFIIQFNTKFFYYEYLVILCSVPRIVWYGRSYFFSSVLFFVPLMYFLNTFINKHFRIGRLS